MSAVLQPPALKGARKPINARDETAASTGVFRSAFAARRCIVPAELFYEWQKVGAAKQPYAIARTDEAPLAFGGIWEGWRSPEGEVPRTFAIVTTPATREGTVGRLLFFNDPTGGYGPLDVPNMGDTTSSYS